MYTLYARDGSGNAAVEALLAEMGQDYRLEIVTKDASGAAPAAYRAINPLGQVPALGLPDGTVMTESAAIMIYLADQHGAGKLAPAQNDPLRPAYLRWMIFLAASTYTADLRFFYADRYTSAAGSAQGVREAARRDMARDYALLSDELGSKPYFLASGFSGLDIYAAMLTAWAEDLPQLFATHPNLGEHFRRVAERPLIAPIWQRNGLG